MTELIAAVAALERAIAAGRSVMEPSRVHEHERRLRDISRRQGFLGTTVVAALVGGTGSGKSSLLNALAGRELAETGVIRPTTAVPIAWVPERPDPDLLALLDDLGIEHRVGDGSDQQTALVDLPDLDSLELSHRAVVDALLPKVDLAIWVLDPLKYNDRLLHERIAARRDYAPQSLFVLNQVDRLTEEQREEVRADLVASLQRDGIRRPDVVLTSAAPPAGEPAGIEELRRWLADLSRDKRLLVAKLRTDLVGLADALEGELDNEEFDASAALTIWETARDRAADDLARGLVGDTEVTAAARAGARTAVTVGSGPLGRTWHALRRSFLGRALGLPADVPVALRSLVRPAGPGAVDGAATTLTRAVTEVSTRLGGAAGRGLRERVPVDRVGDELRAAAEAARTSVPAPTEVTRRPWWVAAAVLQTLLTLAVLGGVVWWWIEPASVAPGAPPWPAILVGGGLAATALVARAVRASGRAAGRGTAERYRTELARALALALDERVGGPLREVVGDRQLVTASIVAARRVL